MVLQAITMPDDRYDRLPQRSIDFINRYVFPGGFLPSFSAIGQSLRRVTDFRLVHLEDFAPIMPARSLAGGRISGITSIRCDDSVLMNDSFARGTTISATAKPALPNARSVSARSC